MEDWGNRTALRFSSDVPYQDETSPLVQLPLVICSIQPSNFLSHSLLDPLSLLTSHMFWGSRPWWNMSNETSVVLNTRWNLSFGYGFASTWNFAISLYHCRLVWIGCTHFALYFDWPFLFCSILLVCAKLVLLHDVTLSQMQDLFFILVQCNEIPVGYSSALP